MGSRHDDQDSDSYNEYIGIHQFTISLLSVCIIGCVCCQFTINLWYRHNINFITATKL